MQRTPINSDDDARSSFSDDVSTTYTSTTNTDNTGWVTRCVCGKNKEQHGFMIECEGCEVWQHGHCVGVTKNNVPTHYYCERCKPDMHPYISLQPAAAAAAAASTAQGAKFNKPKSAKRKRSSKAKEKVSTHNTGSTEVVSKKVRPNVSPSMSVETAVVVVSGTKTKNQNSAERRQSSQDNEGLQSSKNHENSCHNNADTKTSSKSVPGATPCKASQSASANANTIVEDDDSNSGHNEGRKNSNLSREERKIARIMESIQRFETRELKKQRKRSASATSKRSDTLANSNARNKSTSSSSANSLVAAWEGFFKLDDLRTHQHLMRQAFPISPLYLGRKVWLLQRLKMDEREDTIEQNEVSVDVPKMPLSKRLVQQFATHDRLESNSLTHTSNSTLNNMTHNETSKELSVSGDVRHSGDNDITIIKHEASPPSSPSARTRSPWTSPTGDTLALSPAPSPTVTASGSDEDSSLTVTHHKNENNTETFDTIPRLPPVSMRSFVHTTTDNSHVTLPVASKSVPVSSIAPPMSSRVFSTSTVTANEPVDTDTKPISNLTELMQIHMRKATQTAPKPIKVSNDSTNLPAVSPPRISPPPRSPMRPPFLHQRKQIVMNSNTPYRRYAPNAPMRPGSFAMHSNNTRYGPRTHQPNRNNVPIWLQHSSRAAPPPHSMLSVSPLHQQPPLHFSVRTASCSTHRVRGTLIRRGGAPISTRRYGFARQAPTTSTSRQN